MTMKTSGTDAALMDDSGASDEDAWLEAAIEKELLQIDPEARDPEYDEDHPDEDHPDEDHPDEDNPEPEQPTHDTEQVDLIPSMEQYITWIQKQSNALEAELQECDDVMQESDLVSSRGAKDPDEDYMIELARQEGVDVHTLKQKILQDIAREDEADEEYLSRMSQESDVTLEQQEEVKTEPVCPDVNVDGMPTRDINSNNNSKHCTDLSIVVAQSGDAEEQIPTVENTGENMQAQPGHGVVAEVTEADILEKQLWKQLRSLEDHHKLKQNARQQERAGLREAESKHTTAVDNRRREKQEEIKQEQQQLLVQQQENEAKLLEESEELQRRIQTSVEIYQKELAELTSKTQQEREQFEAEQQQQVTKRIQQQQCAALSIQKHYRGYRTRKIYSDDINELRAALRNGREQKRIKEIESARETEIEANQKQEEIQRQQQQQELEESRLKEEQEQKRLEEENQRKKDEESKKVEEQLMIENEKRKKDEENRRADEEKENEMIRKESEKKRKAEEEKRKAEEIKRMEELKRQRMEAEKERKETERLLKEEEKQRKREEDEKLEKAIKEQVRLKELEDAQQAEIAKESQTNIPQNVESMENSTTTAAAEFVKPGLAPTPPKSNDVRPQITRHSRSGGLLRKSRAFLSGLHPPQAWGEYLPESLENRRVGWIQDCTAWSKILGELRTRRLAPNKKVPRRPISAKNLVVLDKSLILEAARVSALQQVTTVELHDLPGCNLKTLAQCQHLKYLAMQSCHLVTTEGIQLCKELEYVDFQHNQLESLVCKDLSHLVYVDVSYNLLTSIHGLDGCSKLKYLNMAHNRITRIAGLDHLLCLHTLNLSHNQLITCKGVIAAATIQVLDLSHNHLMLIDDIDKLALLQVLDITGNTVTQVPKLCNHVMLHSVSLGENNLTDIDVMCGTWLPMLYTLNLENNRLTILPDLTNLLSLRILDVSNNQLLDLESILPGLSSLRRLQYLSAEGNPVTEESDWRSVFEDKLSGLEKLNGVELTTGQFNLPRSRYELMCHGQLQQHLQLVQAYQAALCTTADIGSQSAIHCQYYTSSYNLATEQRYSHEYGEISTNLSSTVSMNFTEAVSHHTRASETKTSSQTLDLKAKFDSAMSTASVPSRSKPVSSRVEQNLEQSSPKSHNMVNDVKFDSMLAGADQDSSSRSRPSPHQIQSMNKESQAETVDMKSKFDAMLSGAMKNNVAPNVHKMSSPVSSDLRTVSVNEGAHGPVREKTSIGAHAVGQILRQEGFHIHSSREHSAATKIQALWRGHLLRKRLQNALSYARQEPELDDDLDMDFGEVDLDAFNFNEDDLEKDWLPPEVPQLPTSHPVIKHPMEDAVYSKPPHPPHNTRQVWRGVVSPPSEHHQHEPLGGKPPLPPLSRLSDHTTDTQTDGAHTYRSKMSKKEERITEEWGFKDSRTAELMIQRAKKLKYNAMKKKRLGQLDPKQRLALLRKLQETAKVKAVVPFRKGSERREYFQAQEANEKREERDKYYESQNRDSRTFEWLHTQVGEYEVTSSRIQNREPERTIQPTQQSTSTKRSPIHLYNSDSNLPRMDPNVLAGGRTLLMGSPLSMDLQSVESTSIAGDMEKPRRLSLTRSDSGSDRLPPIKTSSAPSGRPEKMSWRNPEVNKSVGWGGGKKRTGQRH